MAIRQHGTKLNNAQSTKNQIGPIQYFPAKTVVEYRSSTDGMVRRARFTVSVRLHVGSLQLVFADDVKLYAEIVNT